MRFRKTIGAVLTAGALAASALGTATGAAAAGQPFVVTNSASFDTEGLPKGHVAGDSLATLFDGPDQRAFTNLTCPAASQPLPTTLCGVQVQYLVRDGGGDRWLPMELLYVSPFQINVHVPNRAADNRWRVVASDGSIRERTLNIATGSAVGVFSASGSGQGPVKGQLYVPGAAANPVRNTYGSRVTNSGVQFFNDPVPLTNTRGEANRVVFYVTGLAAGDRPSVVVSIGGVDQTVEYAGPAPGFVGLQQVNIALDPSTPVGDDLPLFVDAGQNPSTVTTTISLKH